MVGYPDNSWEHLKSLLSVRFADANDPHHAFTMLCKAMQVKYRSVHFYTEMLYTLANDALTNVDKTLIESQLVGFVTDWLYHDFLHMKVMRENPKPFQAAVQSALAEQNVHTRFYSSSNDNVYEKSNTKEPIEIDHMWSQKMFLVSQAL